MKCKECTHSDKREYAWVTCTLRASLRDSYGPPVCKHDPNIEALEDCFFPIIKSDPSMSAEDYYNQTKGLRL